MADIVSKKTRSRMMSGIKNKNTKPELIVRRALHGMGFRFRLHVRQLRGCPDLVLPRFRAVIFIHGCFWHMHSCHLFKWPSTRESFWREKLCANAERDQENLRHLMESGWRVCIIWECALKGKSRLSINDVASCCSDWILSDNSHIEICGETIREVDAKGTN